MSQIEAGASRGLTIEDVPLSAIEGHDRMEEYAEALRAWAGDPSDLYPRLDKKEAKGAVVSFRLPESFERQLDRLVQIARERGLPWGSRTDFVRDAVVWFSEVVQDRLDVEDPFLESLAAGRKVADRLEMMNGAVQRAGAAVKGLETLLANLLASGRLAEGRAELARFHAHVHMMAEPYIRRQYELALDASTLLQGLTVALEDPK